MAEQKQKYSEFRGQPRPIPKFAVPKRYDLKLKPDLSACKFSGAVQISVDVVSATKFLVLNAGTELAVKPKSASFASANKFVEAVEIELFADEKIVILEFKESLPIVNGVLSLEFEGTLNERVKGFCRRIYRKIKKMSVIKFDSAAEARRYFPCLDEPAAPCKIILQVTPDVEALLKKLTIGDRLAAMKRDVRVMIFAIVLAYIAHEDPRHGFNGAVMAHARPEIYEKYVMLNRIACIASLSVMVIQVSQLRMRAQLLMLQQAVSALGLAHVIVLYNLRGRFPVLELLANITLVSELKKYVYVDDHEEERMVVVRANERKIWFDRFLN